MSFPALDPDDRAGQGADDPVNRLDGRNDKLAEGVDIFGFDEHDDVVRTRDRFGGDHAGQSPDAARDVGGSSGVGLDQDVRSDHGSLLALGGQCTGEKAGLVAVCAESKIAGEEASVIFVGIEDHPLSLAQHAKHRTFERAGAEVDLRAIVVPQDDPDPGSRVVDLDDPLHELDLLDFAGLDARGAYADTPGVAAVFHANALDVWEPSAAGTLVREAHLLPEPRLLAADFTPV